MNVHRKTSTCVPKDKGKSRPSSVVGEEAIRMEEFEEERMAFPVALPSSLLRLPTVEPARVLVCETYD